MKFVLNECRLRKSVKEFPQTGGVLREKCCGVALRGAFMGLVLLVVGLTFTAEPFLSPLLWVLMAGIGD